MACDTSEINYGCQPKAGNSCTFPATPGKKKEKHTLYFCPHQTSCALCNTAGISRERHYLEEHPYETQVDIELKPLEGEPTWLTLKQDFGRVFCKYWFSDDTFQFIVYTPFNKEELKHYECLFGFHSEPVPKKYVNIYYAKSMVDWELTMPKNNFLEYGEDRNVFIYVSFRRNDIPVGTESESMTVDNVNQPSTM